MINKKLKAISFLALSILISCTDTFKNNEIFETHEEDSNYIIVLKQNYIRSLYTQNESKLSEKDLVISTLNDLSALNKSDVLHLYHRTIMGGLMRLTKEQAHQLAKDSRVAYIEKDQKISLKNKQANPTWGLDRIDQKSLPLNQLYEYKTEAANVNVYVIDTGILTSHTEFEGRAQHGINTIDSASDATDCNGHGTHVAGTIGGKNYGVAKKVKLFGVRVFDCVGSGTYSSVIAGVEWVTTHHSQPAIANMSLGGPISQALDDAIKASISSGITYVVAAGNENTSACNSSPARISEAITVGSTDSKDSRSSFSNYGSCVDIFAPGSDIISAWYNSNIATTTISGTSMAAPHVAGVAALMLATQPQSKPSDVLLAITSKAVSNKLSNILNSPNLLLNTNFINDELDLENNRLENGVEKSILSSLQSEEIHFRLSIPSGATNLEIKISEGTGDADLYVRKNAPPTISQYECRPYKNGNEESCTFANPLEGEYYIMIRAYRTYSNLKIVANYTSPFQKISPCPECEVLNGRLNGSNDRQYQPDGNYYETLRASSHKFILIGPEATNFDLYLYKWSGTQWVEVAKSVGPKSDEKIIYNGTNGYYLLEVRSIFGIGNYQLFRDIQ